TPPRDLILYAGRARDRTPRSVTDREREGRGHRLRARDERGVEQARLTQPRPLALGCQAAGGAGRAPDLGERAHRMAGDHRALGVELIGVTLERIAPHAVADPDRHP